jgi:hypothetical protein
MNQKSNVRNRRKIVSGRDQHGRSLLAELLLTNSHAPMTTQYGIAFQA